MPTFLTSTVTRRVTAVLLALLGIAFILVRGNAIGYIGGALFMILALTLLPKIERE